MLDSYIKKVILGLLILSGLAVSVYSQDKQIGGIVNVYRRVVAIGPGLDNVTLNRVDSIAKGDTVLLIQMQGVEIVTTQDSYGLYVQDTLGTPGAYEFLIVDTVYSDGTKKVGFKNNILNSFALKGNVQLIRVPYYNSATVSSKLTARSWDATQAVGGVVAMIVGRKLKLNADIDVSGKGFIGGKDELGLGECVTAGVNNNYDSYPDTWTNAGYKGEGLALHDQFGVPLASLHAKGQGINFTGGGGGNGKYSGGGGGSNRGIGGNGTGEKNFGLGACSPPFQGAYGGTTVKTPYISNGLFLGGGGGTSTHASGSSGSSGGNGGGIVIIIADTISGNGNSIKANGATALNASGDGGAGGGGGGGSIILSTQSFSNGSDLLTLSVIGGNGGINPAGFGSGGGGGAGLIWVSKTSIPSNVPMNLNYGIGGTANPTNGNGQTKFSFNPTLNGFLFNSVRSQVTGNQIDSICSNVLFGSIIGTKPVGGNEGLGYHYKWQSSTVSEKDVDFSDVPVSNDQQNYTPPAFLTQTTWFRRIVTDNSSTPIIDKSKPVKVIVFQKIENNLIVASPDTICINSDPQLLKQGVPDIIVPTTKYLKYIWQDSTIGGTWGLTLAPDNLKEYDPNPSGGLLKDTWYRRIVKSGACVDKSGVAVVRILPKIADNAFTNLNDTICFGGNINLNTITGPTGGLSGKYKYQWESSLLSSTTGPWTIVAGETSAVYDPDASVPLPVGDHFFRRIVFSGELNTCKDTAPSAIRKVWPVIANNSIISADLTIGYDSMPPKMLATDKPLLTGGDGSYKFSWEKATLLPAWTTAPGIYIEKDYTPPVGLQVKTWFRRRVNSSVCTSVSDSVKITVDAPIINTIALAITALDTIYTGQDPGQLIGSIPSGGSGLAGDYSYKWYKSLTGGPLASEWIEIIGSNLINLSPGNLAEQSWFRRDVSSPIITPRSTYQSNKLKVTVLPKILNVDISQSQSVCIGKRPLQLKGAALSGGDGRYRFTWQDSTSLHSWQDIPGFVKGDSADFKPPVMTSDTKYKRIVYSGKNNCGSETSRVVIMKVDALPTPVNAGRDTTLNSFDNMFHASAAAVQLGSGQWSVLEGSGTFDDYLSNSTVIRNMTAGMNKFQWEVTNGKCVSTDILAVNIVNIFVPEGFSPNHDAFNNTFIITGLDLPNQEAELKIINGAGAEVFSTFKTDDVLTWKDWDGTNSNGIDLPEGTYYYLLKLISKGNGQVFLKSGFVVLKRY